MKLVGSGDFKTSVQVSAIGGPPGLVPQVLSLTPGQGGTVTLDVKDQKKLETMSVGDPVVAAFVEALAIKVKKVPGATPSATITEARVSSPPG